MNGEKFNDEETEALMILAEEASELSAIIMKTLRHGPAAIDHSVSPPKLYQNLEMVEREAADVIAAMAICDDLGLIGFMDLDMAVRAKLTKMQPYLHFVDARQLALDFTMDGK